MDGLNAKDERIADLTATGFTAAQVAAEIGCSVTTVYVKLRHPLIKARIAEQRAAELRPLHDRLFRLTDKAVAAVEAVLDDATATHRDKTKAAEVVFDRVLQLRKLCDEAPALAALIAQLQELQGDTDADA
jgi:hypothetical protein